MKLKLGIRAKILISFLALSLISVGIVSSIAIRNIGEMGYLVKQDSISMGETVVTESIAALEDLGRTIVQETAGDVALEMQLFIQQHPDLSTTDLKGNADLREFAVRPVGRSGSTMVYATDYTIYLHENSSLIGKNLHELSGEPVHFWSIIERSLVGEASGYYEWEDPQGNSRLKYMHTIPVEGADLVVAASTYIDEFSEPAEDTKERIAAAVLNTSQYIDQQMQEAQMTFMFVIIGMIVIVSGTVFLLARTITRPIMALTRGSEVIGGGKLDYSIKVNTGDEIQQLAEHFNDMANALKESYANLEQKVEERTRGERRRVEQLRTINEVGRKISSFLSLDRLLQYVVTSFQESFKYYNVNIFLFEPDSGNLFLKAGVSTYEEAIPVGEDKGESIVGWVARVGEPLLANDVSLEPKYRFVEELSQTKSELAVPVKMGDKVLGVLDIASIELDAFSEADLFTAQTLADQLAVAIENAHLYQETRDMAVLEERNRMAREIHDTLAQGFTGIILQLEAAEQAMEEDPSETQRHLDQARILARKSLNEARRSVWALRPQALEQLPLTEVLSQETDIFTHDSDANAYFTVSGDQHPLPSEVEAVLLRICQESLANVHRHAQANEVKIDLTFEESAVSLTISDNGIGFDDSTQTKGAFGLISMRERARSVGGTLALQTGIEEGTIVRVTIPFK